MVPTLIHQLVLTDHVHTLMGGVVNYQAEPVAHGLEQTHAAEGVEETVILASLAPGLRDQLISMQHKGHHLLLVGKYPAVPELNISTFPCPVFPMPLTVDKLLALAWIFLKAKSQCQEV